MCKGRKIVRGEGGFFRNRSIKLSFLNPPGIFGHSEALWLTKSYLPNIFSRLMIQSCSVETHNFTWKHGHWHPFVWLFLFRNVGDTKRAFHGELWTIRFDLTCIYAPGLRLSDILSDPDRGHFEGTPMCTCMPSHSYILVFTQAMDWSRTFQIQSCLTGRTRWQRWHARSWR